MGSTPSTPVRETSDDPWWPIENQNLDLNPQEMDRRRNANVNQPEQQPVHAVHADSTHAQQLNEENTIVDEIDRADSVGDLTNETDKSVIENVSAESSAQSKKSDFENSSRQQSLDEFKEELRIKREMRTNAISELRNEISSLRQQLTDEKEITKQLRLNQNKENLCQICNSIYNSLEDSAQVNATANANGESSISLRSQLAEIQFSLQNANAEILTLTSELGATRKQAKSLKEVIAASKEIIEIRETELTQLKAKLKDIENSLAERELHVMSENLRQEYDRQLVNIRNLRALYEERARISAAEKENLNRQLETSRAELNSEIEKNKNLEDHIASLDTDLKSTTTELYATKEQLNYYKAENRNLHDEMTVVNQLFGQLLAGFNGNNNIDIDKLTVMLEENRDLLNDITNKENCMEGAAQFPKLIFDLVSQAEKTNEITDKTPAISINSESTEDAVRQDLPSSSSAESKVTSAQEIIHNLPKVWRVLTELLNHQQVQPVPLKGINQQDHCYKSVQTPTGPQMVLSVSKTYIRLKDLIMEKKFLQKETKKLKNLNTHLEDRLGEQEQRLSAVTIELNKTWNLVGRMQRQHRQLHTHEQVLRYQLQQKRRMLSELKEELEYCRRKWALAKEKNNESQSQWESLRLEFSKRKESDLNISCESGYSDSPASEDESSVSSEKPRSSRLKKKLNIDNFLHASDPKDRKSIRNQSASPVRIARESMTRRNSDSHITQYATEEFQSAADVVQPIVHVCAECGENCVLHSVHFDTDTVEVQKSAEQLKVSEAVVHSAKHEPSNAQRLFEAKALTSSKKMCCELRKQITALKPSTSKREESLEEMFNRLSGEPGTETPSNSQSNESFAHQDQSSNSDENCAACDACGSQEKQTNSFENVTSTLEEREQRRLARIERLEGQCKQLMKQVTRASSRGDELNKRINDVHGRYTPVRDTPSNAVDQCELNQTESIEAQPSTSGIEKLPSDVETTAQSPKSDEECLSTAEQAYLSRRDERLKRLEAESQAHINQVKTTNQRATDVDNKLEFLHGRYSGDTEKCVNSNSSKIKSQIQEDAGPSNSTAECQKTKQSPKTDEECLSANEREYLARRDDRLKRLEAESQAFVNRIKTKNQRTATVDTQLEALHERHGSEIEADENVDMPINITENIHEDAQIEENETNQSADATSNDANTSATDQN